MAGLPRRTLTRSRKLTAKAESMATLERQLMEEIVRDPDAGR